MRLILFIVLLYQTTMAQVHTITGSVYSEEIPLEGASIVVRGTNIGTITNSEGQFNINISSDDPSEIIISSLGHKPHVATVDSSVNLGIIELQVDDSFQEVVISGTLKPVSKLESPVPVEVYSHAFFKANPTSSVFEALEYVNGIRPQLNCNVCNTGDIHINGQEGSYTMVLIDGLPIVSGLSTVYGLSGIPQSLIDQIEIIKGPASTLYGSEAIGGVINLITKSPEKTSKLTMDSFVSGWGELNTDVGYSYSLSKNSTGLLGINYFNYSNPIDKNDDGITDLTLQDRISIFQKLNFGNQLSLSSRFVYEDRWGGELNWTPKYRGGDQVYGESIYTRRFELFGRYQFNKNLFLQFSFNDHDHDSVYGDTVFNANQSISFGQLIWNNSFEKHELLFGLTYRYTFYDDDTTATFDEVTRLNQSEKTHLPGIFVQNLIELKDTRELLLGLRYDYNSLYGNILTPRLNYKLSNKNRTSTLRLSAGSGYRVVQVFTEDHAALTGARDVVFLNDLDPERSWNVNLNYVKNIYFKQGVILDFDFSVFGTQFSNKIIPDYDTDPNKIIYDNLNGISITQGASLNVNLLSQSGYRINLGATYLDSYIKEDEVKTRPYLTERFQGVWRLEKKWLSQNIIMDLTGVTVGPLKLPKLGELDPRPSFSNTFNIVNLQITKIWNNTIESYGGIKNILNYTPPANSISRPFDPFDTEVTFDAAGNALPTDNNPYALTFDPSYVYTSNQGIRLFFGLRWSLN
ncbi:MAG: TonB-dependent receptor plug domain-containing protein [Flavobacteriaceae bacterium]|nr:TonB-dependent receptor plug domain-containing protein [Flavobacteriaceae bacterium]